MMTVCKSNENKKPRALFIVPADYDALKKKGVLSMLDQREEGGYFDVIRTVHPFSYENRIIQHSDVQTIFEYNYRPPKLRPAVWGYTLWRMAYLIRRICKQVKRDNIDFIRAQDPYLMGLIGWCSARISGIKLCVSIHSDYDLRHKLDPQYGAPRILGSRRLAEKIEKFVLMRADMVLPIRESLAKSYIRKGVSPEKIHVFPHAVDLSSYLKKPESSLLNDLGIPQNKILLSFVGRFSKENFIDDYIELASNFIGHPDVRVILAGGGIEEERIRKKIAERPGLEDIIVMPGFISPLHVRHLRQLSYINLAFMGGLSLIEACASARPVIAYDVEWHHEIVENGVTGYLISEGDVKAVHKKVLALVEKPDLAKDMGQNAQKRAFERHDFNNIVQVRRDAYDKLIGRKE